MDNKILINHGVSVARMNHKGFERKIYIAIGMFEHHGDGVLVRVAVGLSREAAIESLKNEHNPTLIAFETSDVTTFMITMNMSPGEGTMPEFIEGVQDELESDM